MFFLREYKPKRIKDDDVCNSRKKIFQSNNKNLDFLLRKRFLWMNDYIKNKKIIDLETKETELFPGLRANVTGIRPIVDASANVTIKTRDRLVVDVTTSASSSMNDTGINPVRQSGRDFRANVKIPAESIWTNAQGIDLTASQGGSR